MNAAASPSLRVWLATNGSSQAEFARSLGLKPNRFAQYMSGARRMPLEIAIRVIEATDIPIRSLLPDQPSGKPMHRQGGGVRPRASTRTVRRRKDGKAEMGASR